MVDSIRGSAGRQLKRLQLFPTETTKKALQAEPRPVGILVVPHGDIRCLPGSHKNDFSCSAERQLKNLPTDTKSGGRPEASAAAVGIRDELERFGLVAWGEIEALTPSLNDVLGLHFAELRRKKRDWRLRALLAFDRYEVPRAEKGEVRGLRIVSHRCRLVDRDNLVGGVKFLVDGMKRAGFIFDDSPAVLRLSVTQEQVRTKRDERTIVGLYFGTEARE